MSWRVSHDLRNVCLGVLVALLWPVAAGAQTIVDATRVEFTPSADHNSVETDGTPIVSTYSLRLFVAGGVTPVETVDLGKPAPDPDGFIRVDFVALLVTPPTPGILYEVTVSAVGPGGSADSGRSNTVSYTAPCSYAISPTSLSAAAAGGSSSSTVTAGAGCAWTAVSNVSWITVTSGASGVASGTTGFSVAANTAATSRTGTLTIAGSTFTVTQSGTTTCAFSISPASQSVAASGSAGSVAVTTTAGCAWTSVSGGSWVTVTSGASGSGSGSTGFSVAANTATTARSVTVTIAGKTFTVNQAAAACSYTVTPASVTAAAAGSSGAIGVTTQSGCAWSGTSPVGWITLNGTGPGSGNVSYTVAVNTGAARTATLTIGGKSVTVTQAVSTRPNPPSNLRIVK
jgi:Putative binding domain, N-terminal